MGSLKAPGCEDPRGVVLGAAGLPAGTQGLWDREERHKGFPHRFKTTINVVDATTIKPSKHRRRKAAAKCHMRLDLQSLLPRFGHGQRE